MTNVIEVEGLSKQYGDVHAVKGVAFRVRQGEIFGMVGPNGAGKTTTIECVEGLRQPDGGHIRVLGKDPRSDRMAVVQRIGVQLQESDLPARIKPREALRLFASFYDQSEDAEGLLRRLGIVDKRDTPIAKLSGGQKQRLFIALALINKPEIIFLDELTTGLDPQARRAMWDLVREIRDQGRTIFLTTHYMEEAERLCDRVAILDHGRIVALDTPEVLIHSLGMEKRIVCSLSVDDTKLDLSNLDVVNSVNQRDGKVTISGRGDRFISTVVRALEDAQVPFHDLQTIQPSLEDVFLELTGREMRE
jgi:ABC-2 type transport system ATP-binding protein